MWRTNGNNSATTSVQNSTEWMQINPEILVYPPAKGSLSGGGLRCYFFLKSTSNARKMESNMQLQSKQLDRESTGPEKRFYYLWRHILYSEKSPATSCTCAERQVISGLSHFRAFSVTTKYHGFAFVRGWLVASTVTFSLLAIVVLFFRTTWIVFHTFVAVDMKTPYQYFMYVVYQLFYL